jgi:transposase-like protein
MQLPRATRLVLNITGVKHWLWRAVDQTGIVLDILVQRRRDKKAAKRLLRKLMRKQMRAPRVMITDKLASYGAAKREVMPGIEHRQHKRLNNRAENSHQPTRRRERQMKQFKSAGQVLNSGCSSSTLPIPESLSTPTIQALARPPRQQRPNRGDY